MPKANEKDPTEIQTFEEAFSRLEEISRELEEGQVPLQKSFDLFEEGQKLLKYCLDQLDRADKKLKILTKDTEGFSIDEETLDEQ